MFKDKSIPAGVRPSLTYSHLLVYLLVLFASSVLCNCSASYEPEIFNHASVFNTITDTDKTVDSHSYSKTGVPSHAEDSSRIREDIFCYKKISDSDSLKVIRICHSNTTSDDLRPSIVFFHGGSWSKGEPKQFDRQARYFASLGYTCFLPEYRIYSKYNTLPDAAVDDAKDLVIYLKQNYKLFKIDPSFIVGSGGSAGGHLAMMCNLNAKKTDSVDSTFSLLILFNPALDLRRTSFINMMTQEQLDRIDPIHNLNGNLPRTLMMFGENDPWLPYADNLHLLAQSKGLNTEILKMKNASHGFFNYGKTGFSQTIKWMEEYLHQNRYHYYENE